MAYAMNANCDGRTASQLRAVPAGCINRENERLRDATRLLDEQIAQLEELSGRLFGCDPCGGVESTCEKPFRDGAIGRITDTVDDVFARAERLGRVTAGLIDAA